MTVLGSVSGFTLLEILVALLLVSVIIGVSAFFLGGKKPVRLEPAAWEVSTAVKRARVLARMDRLDRILIIDLDARSYGLEGYARKTLPSGVSLKIMDPQYGEVSRGEYRMIFPGGGGMEGGTIVLGDGRRTVAVQLDPIEGAVLSPGEPGDER
jgi:prepilin-type N-terminal cleavage/methylation domain-containing protein